MLNLKKIAMNIIKRVPMIGEINIFCDIFED